MWQIICKYIYQINNQFASQQLPMIRHQHKSKFGKDTGLHSGSMFKGTFGKEALTLSNDKKCKNIKKNERKQQCQLRKHANSPARRKCQKQNNSINRNTLVETQQFSPKLNTDEFDQISQIKYISKQYSSIRGQSQNDLDYISDTIAANQLDDDFSPLFEPILKGDQDDFILEMYDIQETEPNKDNEFIKKSKEEEKIVKNEVFYKSGNVIGNQMIVGKIKRNKAKDTNVKAFQPINEHVKGQINYIFNCLDSANTGILNKNNCANEWLTTQLNYLIGSLLNSIKTKGKQCEYYQFQRQFNKLVEDSEPQQLCDIFNNNRKKKERITNNHSASNNCQGYVDEYSIKNKYAKDQKGPISPNFKQSNKDNANDNKDKATTDRLLRMNQKVNLYLLKNNLVVNQKPKQKQIIYEADPITLRLTKDSNIYNGPTTKQVSIKQSQISASSLNMNESEIKKSSPNSLSFNTSISIRSDSQTITGMQGSSFELNFLQLNRHL